MAVCVEGTKLRLDCPLLIAGVAPWRFEPCCMTTTDHSATFQLSDEKRMMEQQGSKDTKTK